MAKNNQMTVTEIFDLLRNGKQHDGVELLYKHHYNKMYGVAFSIVKKEDISQDIVHNVIYKLMLLETNKFPTSSELTWLYTVVKNESLMFLRNNNPIISLDDVVVPIVEDRDIHDFVDMDSYYSMIKGLNDEQQQVVTLKVLGGYTHKEISKMLGKPIGTIQWIYNTSIKKLKITLSSVMIAIILSGVGFIARLVNYITKTNTAPEEIPGQTTYIPFDYLIAVFAVVFISLSIVFLLIFKKSYKIPTKADRKNI